MKPLTSGRIFVCPGCGSAYILPMGCPDHPGMALVDPTDPAAREVLTWRDTEARTTRIRRATGTGFFLGAGVAAIGWLVLALTGIPTGPALGFAVMVLGGLGGALVFRTAAARRPRRWFTRWVAAA